jgi:hypothetical protein
VKKEANRLVEGGVVAFGGLLSFAFLATGFWLLLLLLLLVSFRELV